MKAEKKKVNKLTRKNVLILGLEAVTFVLFATALSFYMGSLLAICISVILFLGFFVVSRNFGFDLKKDIRFWINDIVLSATAGYFVLLFFDRQIKNIETPNRIFLFLAATAVFVLPFVLINNLLTRKNSKNENAGPVYLYLSLSLVVFYFIVIIDFPTEVFLNNASEFSYTLTDEIVSQLALVPYLSLAIFVLALLPAKAADYIFVIVSALNVCVYAQYMFFNRYIGQIFGGTYNWKQNPVFSVLSLAFWAVIVASAFLVKKFLKKKSDLYVLAASGVVFALLFVSLITTVIKAPEEAFQYDSFYVSGKEQFTIGKKNNFVLFVIDAVDNSYIKEIMADDPEFFEEYNDFTLFTDTCSVYDLTSHSVPNMILGYTYLEEENKRGVPFLKRFRDNGYRILFYNVYAGMEAEYVDNYEQISDKGDLLEINYDRIQGDMTRLALFQALPCVAKNAVRIEDVSFTNYVCFGKDDYEMIGNNDLYEENLHLTYNENSDNCFYYIHLEGAHFPCEDLVGESKYCLTIFKEYMRQLKELGVYDDAAIIVCADHGRHDDDGEMPYPSAATPMFMVKKAGEKHDKMVISGAPMYYMDFQSTMLVAAGLFHPDTDYDLFGKSVYDYKEGDVRTRTWFDTDFHEEGIVKVTYTGDTAEFERVVNAGEYEKVDSWAFRYSEE